MLRKADERTYIDERAKGGTDLLEAAAAFSEVLGREVKTGQLPRQPDRAF